MVLLYILLEYRCLNTLAKESERSSRLPLARSRYNRGFSHSRPENGLNWSSLAVQMHACPSHMDVSNQVEMESAGK